jgi:hypothetical protein
MRGKSSRLASAKRIEQRRRKGEVSILELAARTMPAQGRVSLRLPLRSGHLDTMAGGPHAALGRRGKCFPSYNGIAGNLFWSGCVHVFPALGLCLELSLPCCCILLCEAVGTLISAVTTHVRARNRRNSAPDQTESGRRVNCSPGIENSVSARREERCVAGIVDRY